MTDPLQSPPDKSAVGPGPLVEAIAVAALVAVAYVLMRTAPALAAGAFSDDGVYLSLGKALAEGSGYRSLYAVGEPVHLKYPPALPAIYALLWTLRSDLAWVHAASMWLSLSAAALAMGLVWWVARTRFSLHPAVAAVLVTGPMLLEGSVQYFNLPISEPWFMLGWASCLLIFPLAVERSPAWAIALGVTAALTTLFRTQAVVLVGALVLALVMARRGWRRPLLAATAAGVPLLAWKLWHGARVARGPLGTQPDEATYTSWAPDSVVTAVGFVTDVLGSQLLRYSTVLPPHLSGWAGVGIGICALVAVGLVVGCVVGFRTHPAEVLSTVALAGVIGIWPYSQDRFVLALLPFVGLLSASGLQWLVGVRGAVSGVEAGSWTSAPSRILLGTLFACIAVVGLRQIEIRGLATEERTAETFYFHPAQYLPDNSQFVISASRWVAANTQTGDRLLTPLSSALWLYTGRKGVNATPAEPDVGPSVFDEPGRFLASRVLADDVTHLLLWNPNFLITRDGAAVQAQCPSALEFLQMTDEPARVAVFRIHKDDECFRTRFLDPAR